jgi:hypothetical protein
MSARFPCPYLGGEVELTDEREQHIAQQHPNLLPAHRDLIGETLADPDQVRRSTHLASARLFSRWYDTVRTGRQVVVVVVTDAGPGRHWIVTAYTARKLRGGTLEWNRN